MLCAACHRVFADEALDSVLVRGFPKDEKGTNWRVVHAEAQAPHNASEMGCYMCSDLRLNAHEKRPAYQVEHHVSYIPKGESSSFHSTFKSSISGVHQIYPTLYLTSQLYETSQCVESNRCARRSRHATNVGGKGVLNLVAAWLKQFLNTHKLCGYGAFDGIKPARLLHLSPADARLVECVEQATGLHRTLSHCWGK